MSATSFHWPASTSQARTRLLPATAKRVREASLTTALTSQGMSSVSGRGVSQGLA